MQDPLVGIGESEFFADDALLELLVVLKRRQQSILCGDSLAQIIKLDRGRLFPVLEISILTKTLEAKVYGKHRRASQQHPQKS